MLRLAGSPATAKPREWVVVLSLGDEAVISHEWAGRNEGLPALPLDVWSVTLPPSDHRPRPGFVVHQQQLDETDIVLLDGSRTTAALRTVCDLSTVVSPARLKLIVEAAHFDLGHSFTTMGTTLLRVGTVGRSGARRLSTVLDQLGPGDDVARSQLEGRLNDVLRLSGLPAGQGQYPLPGTGRRKGFVDRAFPEAKLIIEADGRKWHARAAAMAVDRQRDLEAARVGWFTLRLMYEQLVADPDDVAAALTDTYRSRIDSAA